MNTKILGIIGGVIALVVLIAGLVFLNKPKPSASQPITIVTPGQINTLLEKNNIYPDAKLFLDPQYALVSPAWLKKDFTPALHDFLADFHILTYVANRNDCDKFVRAAWFYSGVLHANTSTNNVGLAVGYFLFKPKEGGAHAIIVSVVNDPELRLIFYEPQLTSRPELIELQLTKEEKASCFGIFF